MTSHDIADGRSGLSSLLDRPEVVEWLLGQLKLAVAVSDGNGTVRFASPEARMLLGASVADAGLHEWPQVLGLFLADALTPMPAGRVPLARALDGESTGFEVVYRRMDGASCGRWISMAARPILNASGGVEGAVTIMRDCTQHRDVLEQVVAALDRRGEMMAAPPDDCAACLPFYQRLLGHYDWVFSAVEQTADSVVITDRRGVIQYVNPGFLDTTGFGPEDVLGKTPRVLKSGKHGPEFYQGLWAKILSGEPFNGLVVNRKKSGDLYTAQQSISPIRNAAGRITHFVSVLKDVTELLQSKQRQIEMALAKDIQDRFCGATINLPEYDIAGATVQVQDLGGDYFDFIPLADGSLGLVVADVSGHGVAAALVMAEARACLRTLCGYLNDPGELLTRLNQALAHDLADNRFVTLIFARLDPLEHTLVYANAGHVPGVLMACGTDGRTAFSSLGPPLGIFPDQRYVSSEAVRLKPGDIMLFMSDGVLETRNVDEEEFGVERAVRHIAARYGLSAREILEELQADVRAFEADAAVRDDVTAVVVKVGG